MTTAHQSEHAAVAASSGDGGELVGRMAMRLGDNGAKSDRYSDPSLVVVGD